MSRERPTEADRQQVRATVLVAATNLVMAERLRNPAMTAVEVNESIRRHTATLMDYVTEGRWPA